MALRIAEHSSGPALLERAESWLVRAEAENNLILGLAARNASYSDVPSRWLTIEDDRDGSIAGVAIQTPPFNLLVTRMSHDAVDALAEYVVARDVPVPGVIGPNETAEQIATRLCSSRGVRRKLVQAQRIYELDAVVPPAAITGRLRVATHDDLALVVEWSHAFHRDAGLPASAATRIERDLTERIVAGQQFLLEGDGGRVVSMASVVGFTPRGARIGGVYTPAERRGRGHASTLVAALSQRLLDEGRAFCFLYTDLANPTSNAIYQRVGYRAVSDAKVIAFE